MMFRLGSFNLINEFERASNEPNAEQLTSSSARLQPYVTYLLLSMVFHLKISIKSSLKFCYQTYWKIKTIENFHFQWFEHFQ